MDMNLGAKVKFKEWVIQRYEFRYLRHELDDEKLYKGDPRLLMHIANSPGSSQKMLAESLCIKPGTLTIMIKRMEAAGLIYRRPDKKDMRTLRVYITPNGENIARRTKEVFSAAVMEFYRDISDEELMEYSRIMEKIQKNLVRITDPIPKDAFDFNCLV